MPAYQRCVPPTPPACNTKSRAPNRDQSYTELREAAVVVRKNGSVLMRNAATTNAGPASGIFRGSSSKPRGRCLPATKSSAKVAAQTGITCDPGALLKTMKHGVTRYRITLDCYEAAYISGRARSAESSAVKWLALKEIASLPLSTTGRKIASFLGNPK